MSTKHHILARVDSGLKGSDNRGVRTGASGSDVDGVLSKADVERSRTGAGSH
jgi:hypothetical protein